MIRFLTVFGFLTMMSISFSQETMGKEEVLSLFEKIESSDRTELDDSAKRAQIFRANYFKIIDLIDNQGFVNVDSTYKKKRDRKTIKSGFRATFTHVLQTDPKLILNPEIIELIRIEIHTGNLNKGYLIVPLSVFVHDFPNLMQEEVDFAFDEWGIDESELLHNSK
jgi:hypothetical protein